MLYRAGMMEGFGRRALGATVVAAIAAAGVGAVAASAQAALLTLVGGVAAALLGASQAVGDAPPPAPAPAEAPPPPSLRPLLDAISSPVLLVENGAVTLANRAALALLGEHIVGEDVRVAIRDPAAAARLGEPGGGRPVELVGLGAPDSHWELRVANAGDGRRLVQLIDQTGTHAAGQQRTDFVANASHELRTPLSSVLGYIETLEEAGDEPATRARFLQVMGGEARRMQRLIEDLISLSRIEAEKYRLPARAVDLAALTGEVADELRAAGDGRGADLRVELDPDVPPVGGDATQLSQVLHNLGGNAMKYGRPGTPVTLSLRREGAGAVRLAVSDHGDGIAPQHLPRLTERFYRVDAGRSRALGGTGLGLAIVKHIVERHRGRLDIVSQVGVGTTVSITLPVLTEDAA